MAMVALLVSACSLGSDSGGGSDASGGRERSEAEQPLGTDPEAVTPYVSELLLAYDRLVNEINADPAIARDPDDQRIQEFFDLFDLDEGVEQGFIDGWVAQADEGLRVVPFSEDHPALTTTIDGEVESVSEGEVWVPVCVVERFQEVHGEDEVDDDAEDEGNDTDGTVPDDPSVSALPRIDRPGEATAVRVEDQWVIGEIVISQQELGCNGQ